MREQSIFLRDLIDGLFFIRSCSQHDFDIEFLKFKAQIEAMVEEEPSMEYQFMSYYNIVRNMAEVNGKAIPDSSMYSPIKSTMDVKQAIRDFAGE